MKVDIAICTHKRATEFALLLQALRTQTYQNFDVYVMEDRPGNQSFLSFNFVNCIINRLILEDHRFVRLENHIRVGVSRLRQQLNEFIFKHGDGDCVLTLDDDVIPEPDYIERLVKGIEAGYDIVSGVTPPMMIAALKRDTRFVKPYVDNIELNDKGEIIRFDDNCGHEYIQRELIPALHYRSSAMFKKEVLQKCKFPDDLGFCSFREEEFVAWQAHILGYKFAIDTGAIIYHQLTPSGGNRNPEYQQNIMANIEKHKKYTKVMYYKHGDFIKAAKEKIEHGRD